MLPYFRHCLSDTVSVRFPCSGEPGKWTSQGPGWLEHHSQAKAAPAVPLQPLVNLALPFPLQVGSAARITALASSAECSQARPAEPHCQRWESSQHICPCFPGPEISRGRGWEPVWAQSCLCALCQPSPAYSFPFPSWCSWIRAQGTMLFEYLFTCPSALSSLLSFQLFHLCFFLLQVV